MRRKRGGLPPILGYEPSIRSRKAGIFPSIFGQDQKGKLRTPTREDDATDAPGDSEPTQKPDTESDSDSTPQYPDPNNLGAQQNTTRPRTWSEYSFDGEQPCTQNAIEQARWEAIHDLEDVLSGITFSRVTKWGRPIIVKQPKREYL